MRKLDCNKCGMCSASCPVYKVTGLEPFSPRGKLAVIEAVRAGDAQESHRFEEIMSHCLFCGSCSSCCPSGVDVCSRIQDARAGMVGRKGLSFGNRIFIESFLGLGSFAGRKALKSYSSLQGLISRPIPGDSGFHLKFPASLCTERKWLPPVADRFFLEKAFDQTGSGKMAYFVGCITNYCFPHIGDAVLRTLALLKEKAFVPRNQKCCGFPAYAAGDNDSARELARENVRAFSQGDCEFLITACASCGSHIRSHYPELLRNDPELAAQASKLAEKVMDISALLYKEQNAVQAGTKTSRRNPLKLVYHNPCHLRNGLGILSEPRTVLACLDSVELLDYKDELECCGYGGLFNVGHFDISHDILFRRISNLSDLAPQALITSCMGCLLHWKEGLLQTKSDIKVLHLIELIDLFLLDGAKCTF